MLAALPIVYAEELHVSAVDGKHRAASGEDRQICRLHQIANCTKLAGFVFVIAGDEEAVEALRQNGNKRFSVFIDSVLIEDITQQEYGMRAFLLQRGDQIALRFAIECSVQITHDCDAYIIMDARIGQFIISRNKPCLRAPVEQDKHGG